jgi:hypothetical protein
VAVKWDQVEEWVEAAGKGEVAGIALGNADIEILITREINAEKVLKNVAAKL